VPVGTHPLAPPRVQHVSPGPHVGSHVPMPPMQTPPEHDWPAAHVLPQAPQFVGSESVKRHMFTPPRGQHSRRPVHSISQTCPDPSSRPPAQLESSTLAPNTTRKAHFMTSPLP
jgi:hypothetical protein